jgi:4'-phosphopantetheinyl transferase
MRCATGEVHVWRIELDSPPISLKTMGATLSHEEREKAKSFRSTQTRKRWVSAWGALRYILAAYVRSEPHSLLFQNGRYGKPFLSWPVTNIPFNISHTGGLALVAISSQGCVGVDVEFMQSIVEVEEISRRFFAALEADEILSLAPEARPSTGFNGWCESSRWSLADVGEQGVAVTIAVDGPLPVIRRFDFPASFD